VNLELTPAENSILDSVDTTSFGYKTSEFDDDNIISAIHDNDIEIVGIDDVFEGMARA